MYYAVPSHSYPSSSHERPAFWVGFGESVGDRFTWKLYTTDTKKIIYRSCVRSATDPSTVNLRVDRPEGEIHPASSPIMTLSGIGVSSVPTNPKLHTFDPSDLVGRTFLMPKDENGERLRSHITKVVKQIDKDDLD